MFRAAALSIKGKMKDAGRSLGHTGTVGPQTLFEMTAVTVIQGPALRQRDPGVRY